jgi:anti-sigma factor RsiW
LVVRLDSKQCPGDRAEIAEAYVMGTLRADEAMAFEDHYVACNSCATALEKTASYVDAMRGAAKKLRSVPMHAASGIAG